MGGVLGAVITVSVPPVNVGPVRSLGPTTSVEEADISGAYAP